MDVSNKCSETEATFLAETEVSSLIEVIVVPSQGSKAHTGVQPGKLCVHRLGGECDYRHDVEEIAIPGTLCRGSLPHIRQGQSMLQTGTKSDHQVTRGEDVGYQLGSGTSVVTGADSTDP